MKATEIQAPNTTTPACVAYTESGQRCVRPALPGQLVCGVHQKQRHYEVTRSYLSKCEEILGTAAVHSRSEGHDDKVQGEILKLKIAVNRLRSGLVALCLFALCLCAQAQSTFVNYRLTFVGGTATTNISIGPNVLVRFINAHGVNLTGGTVGVQFPGGPMIQYNIADPNFDLGPTLGPCTISLSVQGGAGAAAYYLFQYDTVNATLPAQGVIVQPAGHGAAIALQSSADLLSWTPATNGVYSATGQNRFFRMSLNLQ